MKQFKFGLFLLLAAVSGGIFTKFILNNNSTKICLDYQSRNLTDSSSARTFNKNYIEKLGSNVDSFQYSIIISKVQFDAMLATRAQFGQDEWDTNIQGFRLLYGIGSSTDQTVKSIVFPIGSNYTIRSFKRKLYDVNLPNRVFSLPCPHFCD